jgi:hypothetical protein
MIKQSQNNCPVVDFVDGAIATLRIPPKLRLRTENERLAVRVLACDHGQYKLMSWYRRISGRYPADDLNEVNEQLIETLGGDIPIEPEYRAGKEVIVPFSRVVAQENNRGSITNAQRARRATAGSGSELAIASGEEVVGAIATATDVVSNVANVLANSPVRQPRRRPQPAPARRPRQRPGPSPEPVNRTRKRRAAGDVGKWI